MPINPIPLSSLKPDYFFLNVMLQGQWDSGKTTFSLGSQRLKTLHLDVDVNGIISAKCFPGNPATGILPIRQDLIAHQPINTVREMYEVLDYCEKNYRYFDLLVVDTVTDLHRLAIIEQMGSSMGTQLKDYEWGPVLNIMRQVTQRLKRLPIHTIFTAHEAHQKKIEDDKYVRDLNGKFIPAFDGLFVDEYANHFSEIWRYVNVSENYKDQLGVSQVYKHRMIQTASDETFMAKSRVTCLDKCEPPILDYILDKIHYHMATNGQNT